MVDAIAELVVRKSVPYNLTLTVWGTVLGQKPNKNLALKKSNKSFGFP